MRTHLDVIVSIANAYEGMNKEIAIEWLDQLCGHIESRIECLREEMQDEEKP